MSFASSRQTIVANIAQQASAVATLLILPNVLSPGVFAETVYIAVLLSFIALADLGLSYVYNRIVPAMSSRGETEAIGRWDRAVCNFGLLSSLVLAAIFSVSYFTKFHSVWNAVLLFPVAPLTFLTSFYVNRVSCLGDFLSYQRMIMLRAVLAAGILPLVMLWGISGWFAGTLLAAAALFAYAHEPSIKLSRLIDWPLVRDNVAEGLIRCGIAVMWLQLLNVGRLYASTHYAHEKVAEYGIAASAYQSLAALIISAFLPVSVETLRRFGHGADDAMQYVHRVAERVAPWTLLGTIAVAEMSPPLFRIFFPAYNLDPVMQASLLSGVIFYPFFIIWGNCLIGARRFFTYIFLILLGLATAWLVAAYFGSDTRGAAIGQFAGLMVYSSSMYFIIPKVLAVSFLFWLRAMFVFILTVGLGVSYWAIRW
jgi:hypothetical protein